MPEFADAGRAALAVVGRCLVALDGDDSGAIRDAFNFLHVRIRGDGESHSMPRVSS